MKQRKKLQFLVISWLFTSIKKNSSNKFQKNSMLRYCWVLPLSNEPKHNYVGPAVTEHIDFLSHIYSRVVRYRPVKPSSDQLRGPHIAQPLLMKSRVLLRSGTRHTRFLSTTWVGKALESFHRKKEYIWLLPHPLPSL